MEFLIKLNKLNRAFGEVCRTLNQINLFKNYTPHEYIRKPYEKNLEENYLELSSIK